MQFLIEEAAAAALELHEAAQAATEQAGGESDVRSRHQRLVDAARQGAAV
jgi:hypothetical protein